MHRLLLSTFLLATLALPAPADHRGCGTRPRHVVRECHAVRVCRRAERRVCLRRVWAAPAFLRLAPAYSRLGTVFTLDDPVFDLGDVRAAYDGAPPAIVGLLGERYLIDSLK